MPRYLKSQRKGLPILGVFPDHQPPHTPTTRIDWVFFLCEYLHENTSHSLTLAVFLVVDGWSQFPARVDTQIVPDPGSPRALVMGTNPAASEQCEQEA